MAKKKTVRKKVQEDKKKEATKKHEKARERRNVRNVTGSLWKTYERMWAEDGVIKIQDKETGEVQHLAPREAALRAQAVQATLANPKLPWPERQKVIEFTSKVIEIIKQAKAQNETPENTNEKIMSNVLSGKTAEGKEIKPITDPEEMLKYLSFKYPMLALDEIKQVCNEQISSDEKTGILQTINADRLMELVQQNERHKQQQR